MERVIATLPILQKLKLPIVSLYLVSQIGEYLLMIFIADCDYLFTRGGLISPVSLSEDIAKSRVELHHTRFCQTVSHLHSLQVVIIGHHSRLSHYIEWTIVEYCTLRVRKEMIEYGIVFVCQ